MKRVGLIGFGKTGRAVASVLLDSELTSLEWVVRQSNKLEHRSVPDYFGMESAEQATIYNKDEFSAEQLLDLHPVDVVIDFSSKSGISYYGDAAAKRGVTIISAVSQYDDEQLDKLKRLAVNTTVMHSPNITVGINFLMLAAKVLKTIAPHTDVEIIEEHFKTKAEVSGTAQVIAENLGINEHDIKTVRAGGIIGVHEVLFGFPYQTVRLKHESIAREAFGNGVLFATQELDDKPTGFYSMEDLMLPYFKFSTENIKFS